MHVAFERSRVSHRTLTALALAGWVVATTPPLRAQRGDTLSRGPVQRAAVIFTRIDSAVRAAGVRIDSTAPLRSEQGCRKVRGAVLGMAAYQGYRAGSLTHVTVRSWHGPPAIVFGAEAVGAATAVVWAMFEPLPRPIPLCPAEMRTISGRSPNGTIGCRASQITAGMLGMSSASVAAGVVAPTVTVFEFLGGRTKAHRRRDRKMIVIGLPLAGAAAGAFDAHRRTPCRSR